MNSDVVHRDLLKFDILNFSMNKPNLWVQKKSPGWGLFSDRVNFCGKQNLESYQLFDSTTSQATCANLNSTRGTVDESLDIHEIGTEHTFGGHTDMLTNTALLLCLTFSWNAVTSNRALSANFTSTSHSYIHLVLDVL